MTMPYYASAEQIMRDRSEYARKGISRGRSVAVLTYSDGVLFIAENPSSTLHKVGELYDRIGFAAVGRYSEFESLRVAGVRLADVRGYSYNRRDVTGRVIANAYAQTLGAVFTEQMKPYEVELCVAEVGDTPEADQLYRLTFDGSIVDEPDFVVMGGQAEAVSGHLREHFLPGMGLAEALAVGVRALSAVSPATAANGGGHDQLPAEQLEVAVLDRRRPKRAFRRVTGAALHRLLSDEPADVPVPSEGGPAPVHEHAPSAPAPGTPPGLGDPEAVDTAGGTERTAAQPTAMDGVGGGTEGNGATGDTSQDSGETAGGDTAGTDGAGSDIVKDTGSNTGSDTGRASSDDDGNTGSDDA